MAVNPNWPLTVTSVAMSADPFDPSAVPVYVDVTKRVRSMDGAPGGRQYELNVVTAGEATVLVDDPDEAFNPTNPGSPYAGNIKPFRRLLDQTMWPPVPVAGAVNLLNLSAWAPGPYDPGFESYASGSLPSWVTTVGGVTASVGTGGARTGSQRLGYTVVNGTTVQGVSWQVPCIPGQQYTSSVYVNQAAASTQSLRVTDQVQVIDAFGRSVSNAWGTADVGGAWTTSGGSASDYAVAGGAGTHLLSTVNASRKTVVGSMADSDVRVIVAVPAVATGAALHAEALSRYADSSNYYNVGPSFNTDSTITVQIRKVVAGTQTLITSATLSTQYTAGSMWNLRVQTIGPTLQAKVWAYGTAEPSAWTATTTDTSLTAAGAVGCRSTTDAGNTNTSPVFSFDQFSAVGSVAGTTTTTTGSYQRLTVTWTATRPLHTIQLATSGTAVAGAVLVDDVQHEPGGTANTAVTTGPVIYGTFAGFVERWPSRWTHQGMRGVAEIRVVDAFGILANQYLHTEYASAVLAKSPLYYWRLNEPQGATAFAESSGNGGPSLVRANSSFGPGPTYAAGATIPIAGDPSGTGFSCNTGSVGSNIPASVAQTGSMNNTPTLSGLGGARPPWSLTVAFWASYSPPLFTSTDQAAFELMNSGWPGSGIAGGSEVISNKGTPNTISFITWWPGGSGNVTVTDNWSDGKPHLFVYTVSVTSSTGTVVGYVDGVQVGTNSAAANSTYTTPWSIVGVQVGGDIEPTIGFGSASLINGVYAHAAIWNRVLSSAEVTDLWNAGKGYVGETSGQRVARYLSYLPFAATAIDTGASTMDVSTLADNTSVLDATQGVTVSENGNLFTDQTGTITFKSRTARYFTITAKWTFGENAAGGEAPYESDVAFDYDPTQVFNDVQITRSGGVTAIGGTLPARAASQRSYGKRSGTSTVNVKSDLETQDAANWLFAGHAQPTQRVATLTIKPSGNPNLWPVALGARLGDRATVKRRTTAGYTMQADYFVEKIEWKRKPGEWVFSFQMSPAALNAQPGIFDDATWGRFDQTFIFGY